MINIRVYFQVRSAMDLSGHKSGIYSFSFSGDTRRAVTVSKDGTWRVFNIDGWYISSPRNEYFLNRLGACPRILRLVHNDFSQTYPIVFFDIQPVFG